MHRFLRKTFSIVLMAALFFTLFTSCEEPQTVTPVNFMVRMFDGEEKKPFLEYEMPAGALMTVPEREDPRFVLEKVTSERREDMMPGDRIAVVADTDIRYQWKRTHWKVDLFYNSNFIRTDYVEVGKEYVVPDIHGNGDPELDFNMKRYRPGDKVAITGDCGLWYGWMPHKCSFRLTVDGVDKGVFRKDAGWYFDYSVYVPEGSMVLSVYLTETGEKLDPNGFKVYADGMDVTMITAPARTVTVHDGASVQSTLRMPEGGKLSPRNLDRQDARLTKLTDARGNVLPLDEDITVRGDMELHGEWTELVTVSIFGDFHYTLQVPKGSMFDPASQNTRTRRVTDVKQNGTSIGLDPIKADTALSLVFSWETGIPQFEWEILSDGNARLTKVVDEVHGVLTVPSEIAGHTVTEIGDRFLYLSSWTTSVILPDTIAKIGKEAFSHSSVDTVVLPVGVTDIPEGAFSYSRIRDVGFRGNVTSIGKDAFRNCSSLENIGSLSKVRSIGSHAFEWCGKLGKNTDGILGLQALVTLGEHAFEHCLSIKEVNMTGNIRKIPDNAFADCSAMTVFMAGSSGYGIDTIGAHAFEGCTMLDVLGIEFTGSKLTIGNEAFAGCGKITELDMNGPYEIVLGTGAFRNCGIFEKFHLNGFLKLDGKEIFSGCDALTGLLWNKVKQYTADAFDNWTGLETLTVNWADGSVIPYSAFNDCPNLNSVTLADNVKEIGDEAFAFCSMKTLTVSASEFTFGNRALWGCGNLWKINLERVKHLILKDYVFEKAEKLKKISIPSNTDTTIHTFLYGSVEEVEATVGDGLPGKLDGWNHGVKLSAVVKDTDFTDIPDGMFKDSTDLVRVEFGMMGYERVRIGNEAFAGCTGLKNISLTDCDFVGYRAFDRWQADQSIDIMYCTPMQMAAWDPYWSAGCLADGTGGEV